MAAVSPSKTNASHSNNDMKLNEKCLYTCEKDGETKQFSIYDIILVVVSLIFVIVDSCTDLFLAIEYYQSGLKEWAWITFCLTIIPSLIVQLVSLRWYMAEYKERNLALCVFHCCCVGLWHRYYHVLLFGLESYRSKDASSYEKATSAQSDLTLLLLFESFLESAPQLVLQLYVMASLQEFRFFTGLSAMASVFALSMSLVTYSQTQRRAYKNQNLQFTTILLQVFWRLGMLTARICSLVLLILCFHGWFLLFISVHWLSMFLWIVYQNTDLCDTKVEERCFNAIAAVIYCFCFFNLKEGKSRWRVASFYFLLVLQNLTSLTVFLMWHVEDTPVLDIVAFIAVVGGTVLGFASMALYYRLFHPSAPMQFCGSGDSSTPHHPSEDSHMRSLKRPYRSVEASQNTNIVNSGDAPQMNSNLYHSDSKLVLTDSVVIVDESDMEDIYTLQSWIKEAVNEQQLKRQDGVSPLDLDEVSSGILSAHDYENVAAVNIARAGGLRHWRGYCDIETYLHDDSIVRDTLTSTTGSSSQDYLDSIVEDYQDCKLSADPVGMFAPSSLDTILEEVESICSEPSRTGGSCTLVATIDQIRITTPVQEERQRGVRRKFSLIREKFESKKEISSGAGPRERSQSPLRVSVKEMRAFFLRQVLTPPKLAALRGKATTSPAP